jgi:hypothetical protein
MRPAPAFLALLACLIPPAAADPETPSEAGTAQPRPTDPIEVVITGPHDWIRAAEQGLLPRTGVTVVHFDAHPDMELPPYRFDPGWPEAPEDLLRAVTIGSFLLAAFRTHLVERAIWVRPSWAAQLPDGERRFWFGETARGNLRVSDESDYYVLLGAWAPLDALGADRVPVQVRVLSLDHAQETAPLAGVGPVVFDIDLDGFATRNPGADRLRDAGLDEADVARLRDLFDPGGLGLASDPATRFAELGELERALFSVAALRWSELPRSVVVLWRRGVGPVDLLSLYRILSRLDRSVSLESLLEAGRQAVSSPEQGADLEEIRHTARALGQLVASGSVRPRLVTVARSVRDGFTPEPEWPSIEWALLDSLRETLGDYRLRYDHGLGPAPRSPSQGYDPSVHGNAAAERRRRARAGGVPQSAVP